jgi:hypothetical protein
MDLLIPASGYATRMNRIPKFLLPVDDSGTSLLETHTRIAGGFYENVIIATRTELIPLLNEKKLGSNVQVVSLETKTMTETILRMIAISSSNRFSVVMPDTYFAGENPHEFLAHGTKGLNLALWEIQNFQRGKLGQARIENSKLLEVVDKDPLCPFPYSWGAMSFGREYSSLLEVDMPHIGYGLKPMISQGQDHIVKVMDGFYYDCGTPSEYFEMTKKRTF